MKYKIGDEVYVINQKIAHGEISIVKKKVFRISEKQKQQTYTLIDIEQKEQQHMILQQVEEKNIFKSKNEVKKYLQKLFE